MTTFIWSRKVLDVSSTRSQTGHVPFHAHTTHLTTWALLPLGHVCGVWNSLPAHLFDENISYNSFGCELKLYWFYRLHPASNATIYRARFGSYATTSMDNTHRHAYFIFCILKINLLFSHLALRLQVWNKTQVCILRVYVFSCLCAFFFCLFCRQNIPDALIDKVGGKVYTFGSFRLGISAKGKCCNVCSVLFWPVLFTAIQLLIDAAVATNVFVRKNRPHKLAVCSRILSQIKLVLWFQIELSWQCCL